MALPQEKQESYTLADALTWDERDRIELIDGEPYMFATPSRRHQDISGVIYQQLWDFLKDKPCKIYFPPFAVRLFEQKEDRPWDVDTYVEPDITVVCDPEKLDDLGCRGAPDLIVEVLSPSTRRHDRITKYGLYQRAGVREYWIVDPETKTAESFVLEDGHLNPRDLKQDGESMEVSVLEGCVIDLTRVFQM